MSGKRLEMAVIHSGRRCPAPSRQSLKVACPVCGRMVRSLSGAFVGQVIISGRCERCLRKALKRL